MSWLNHCRPPWGPVQTWKEGHEGRKVNVVVLFKAGSRGGLQLVCSGAQHQPQAGFGPRWGMDDCGCKGKGGVGSLKAGCARQTSFCFVKYR